jgi:3-oxoacyl-[acyl-carrier protein] reductase
VVDDLTGQVCVITGASRGIGRATAELAAARGAQVVGTYRSGRQEAEALMARAANEGRALSMRPCDVTDRTDVAELIAGVLSEHGRIDSLVNNAGLWRGGKLVSLPEADWRAVLETDLAAVFTVVQAVLPAMLEAGAGRLINVTSVVGVTGYPGDTAYSAAKAGVNALTRSLAKEVARKGLAVNAVAPGPVATEMTEGLPDTALDRLVAGIPLGRQGRPDEVAQVIGFLLGAPLYLNGAVISVDGAMS